MSTVTILAGFALMLFLPCLVAYFSYREPANRPAAVRVEDHSQPLDAGLPAQFALADTTLAELAADPSLLDLPRRATRMVEHAGKSGEMALAEVAPQPTRKSPQAHHEHHATESHRTRIQRSEMEALVANAAAARAQAHALAANARLAVAKADAAEAEATAAETAAAAALDQVFRAA
jgi:hypothetical protein